MIVFSGATRTVSLFQPVFYPVLSESYATQIARDWNTKDEASGFVGYVTRFAVDTAFLKRVAESDAWREYLAS